MQDPFHPGRAFAKVIVDRTHIASHNFLGHTPEGFKVFRVQWNDGSVSDVIDTENTLV